MRSRRLSSGRTKRQSFGPTVVQLLNPSVVQSFGPSLVQSFSHSDMQSLSHSVMQSFSHSIEQLFSPSVTQSFGHSVILPTSFSHSVTQAVETPPVVRPLSAQVQQPLQPFHPSDACLPAPAPLCVSFRFLIPSISRRQHHGEIPQGWAAGGEMEIPRGGGVGETTRGGDGDTTGISQREADQTVRD